MKIYLDHNATTPLDPRVLDAMLADLSFIPANPSSVHSFGREARLKLIAARETIASYLQVKPGELIFTSGGTESLNGLLRGLTNRGHLITSDIEHSAVFTTVEELAKQSWMVSYLAAGTLGAVTPEAVRAAIRPETRCIVLSAVNSETGVKTDIEGIARLALEYRIPFIVDGVALLGKEPFSIPPGVTAMAFSGHKLHAPKGIGLTFVRPTLKLQPQLTGGGQEGGRRSGTENLAGILGLAKAIDLLHTELPAATQRMRQLRTQLEETLLKELPNTLINGTGPRVVNTVNLSFSGVEGEVLLMKLDLAGIAVSHGSACSSGSLEPSRVLRNMGLSKERAQSAVRFSLSRFTTQEEIERAIPLICACVKALRNN